jgi:hypothetical protein
MEREFVLTYFDVHYYFYNFLKIERHILILHKITNFPTKIWNRYPLKTKQHIVQYILHFGQFCLERLWSKYGHTLTVCKLKEITFNKSQIPRIPSQFSYEITFTLNRVSIEKLNCALYIKHCVSRLILWKCSFMRERHAKWISPRKLICVHWCKENANKIFAKQSGNIFLRMLIFMPYSSWVQWWTLVSTLQHLEFHKS